ncbi:hypothetical protein MAPG_06344 [Magnaporthiopsis poae ATCC 64411]|uniref:Uncharacterized protein n=1 Tax=Magnaporthiopsis poae (strain ATCC 64411 / 73-15) TaxID=644358 RepID=A0A0C4E1S5_MAGP6|nr:hypothetical protein MAPG_06344 [Magnaporthiopsis poae ATCC 64411]
MNAPVHWQLHAQMEGRRMQSQQALGQQRLIPMPAAIPRGLVGLPMQHRPGQQPSGTPAYSTPAALTQDAFPGMMNMGQSQGHMPPNGQDAGYVNPLSTSGPSDTSSSSPMGPVPPVEAGAPFPGPGSSTPLFSQHLPPVVGGLDDNPFERPGPASAANAAVNWSQN